MCTEVCISAWLSQISDVISDNYYAFIRGGGSILKFGGQESGEPAKILLINYSRGAIFHVFYYAILLRACTSLFHSACHWLYSC